MRKFLVGLLLLVAVVGTSRASGAANWGTVEGAYEYVLDSTISSSASFDSVIGNASPADSILVLSNWTPRLPGWEWIITRSAVSGTVDSCTLEIAVKCKATSDSLTYTFTPDTVSGTAGEAYELDIGGGALGAKYDVLFRAIAATERGNQIKFNRIYLYRRRVIGTNARAW